MFTACEEELPHNQKVQFDTPAKLNLNVDVNGDVELMAPKTKAYTITVQAKEIADDNLTFTIKVNPDKVQEYNKANGTDYEIVPAEAYSISTNTLYLPRYNRRIIYAFAAQLVSCRCQFGQRSIPKRNSLLTCQSLTIESLIEDVV